MEYSIFDAVKFGFNHIVVITKKENQSFLKNYLSQRLETSIKLDVLVQRIEDIPKGSPYSSERQKPWGTAHAVWTARKIIESPFVIINADDYYGQNAFKGAAEFIKKQKSNKIFGLLGYQLNETLSDFGAVSRGVCKVKNNQLESIVERTKISKTKGVIKDEESAEVLDSKATVSMNFWICSPKIFEFTEPYFKAFLDKTENHEKNEIYLPFLVQEMMENGDISVEVIAANSQWFGMTYYKDKDIAVKTLSSLTSSAKYPSPLWK
tara:strand:- start:596 stop:1390 length:795 start_codon:yes stop_codon:yes gene_type:complete